MTTGLRRSLHLDIGGASLAGELVVPKDADGLAVFASGTAGARHATLETNLANRLQRLGTATAVTELVGPNESADRSVRSDTAVLRRRLEAQVDWLAEQSETDGLASIICGIDTGAAAAVDVVAGADYETSGLAVLNGRLDMAATAFEDLRQPVLFFLDDDHAHLTDVNRTAYERVSAQSHRKHFLHAVNRDALSIVARWISLQFSTPAGASVTGHSPDQQRGMQ